MCSVSHTKSCFKFGCSTSIWQTFLKTETGGHKTLVQETRHDGRVSKILINKLRKTGNHGRNKQNSHADDLTRED